MADKETLLIEEQALFERERGLAEWEATLQEQEQTVVQSERSFKKRNKTLLNLVSYVAEQEANLLRRAAAIGPEASQLVGERLGGSGGGESGGHGGVGLEDQRTAMLERRRELLEARTALVEEREALIAQRYEAIDKAEGTTAEMEQRLLAREREISQALRELITSSASLQGDDDDDDDDDGSDDEEDPARAREAHGPPGRGEGVEPDPVPVVRHTQHSREADDIGREPLEVVGGDVESDSPGRFEGAVSRTEDEVTRRRKGRARARTNQFRITLEAQLDGGDAHHFFTYRDDGPEDLPGIFIATPNLLKVGREVRVRVGLGKGQLEATGIVGWRRQRGEEGGPPGMGVELLNLSEADRVLITSWVAEHPPVQI
ncbi:MAG: hypothetical protein CVU56_02780 [Deltaproteobacteria bacterium HGW-Deltaproteobacteria-14]|jgi:hypothetical protein|nr:MAG: hypothetical protein CVU56_02780 [Deltaproteobacteria bacterium HGW-Deltaproteobacteria-14]